MPHVVSSKLYGDRKKHGYTVIPNDPDWQEWDSRMPEIFEKTQTGIVGTTVNSAGYKQALRHISLDRKMIVEIGPGAMEHVKYWDGTPAKYIMIDRREAFLKQGAKKLDRLGIANEFILSEDLGRHPVEIKNESVDIVIAFYVLEHLLELDEALKEVFRILKPGGMLIGAIPAEGGLAWGLGRFLTTRRWFKKNTNIDLDKIICWEHPNFADDVCNALDRAGFNSKIVSWPLNVPIADLSLIHSFHCEKPC